MKLKTKLTALAGTLSLTTILVACGGGGGGGGSSIAGIGGSGITSTGTITGFGSVIVNGVKYETTDTSFDIEGSAGSQDQLAIGMVVKVNGTINPDGITGTANRIVFDDDLQGPVANFVLASDGLTATFIVLGISVQIDSRTTHFDDDNGGISMTSIANGNIVELSGFFDASGTLIASRIENKTGSDDNVELKGTITGLTGSIFTLKGIPVDASSARLEDLPNGLTNNIRVEVKGLFDGTQITATKIESEAFEYNDGDEFEIEGYVTNFTNNSSFKVNGIPVDASRAELEPRRLQIADNLQIEVEGRLVNGVLIADEVKMRGGDIEVSAYISSIDISNNRFEVTPVEGQPAIVIHTGTETQFENDLTDAYSVGINDLHIGQFVEVEGYQNDDRTVFANKVEITEPDDIEIQGIIQSDPSLGTIKVLGVEFMINGATRFEDDNDQSISQLPTFNDLVTRDRSIIKIEDTDRDGVADKIEIESR